MPPDPSFDALMNRLQAGDQDAAVQIFDRFTRRLIGLARAHLDTLIRQKVDPEDVVQSVYKSFFHRFAEGEFDIASWGSLWGLLAVITVRKCGHCIEYFQSERRDVRAEAPLPRFTDGSASSWDVLASDPTPSQAAMLAETVADLMRTLDERNRQIVMLRLQGYQFAEIAELAGCTERTVQRVLKRVRDWLQERCAGS